MAVTPEERLIVEILRLHRYDTTGPFGHFCSCGANDKRASTMGRDLAEFHRRHLARELIGLLKPESV